METNELELQDIQGIVVGVYGDLDHASFLCLGIKDAAAARGWLGSLRVRMASGGPPTESSVMDMRSSVT